MRISLASVSCLLLALCAGLSSCGEPTRPAPPPHEVLPVPDKLVVLTFDDGVRSHITVARPKLLEYGFGATFFITHGFSFPTNKTDYLTWEEIAQLSADGFEIGNHTGNHAAATGAGAVGLPEQLAVIDAACEEHGVPKTRSFAWPGNVIGREGWEALRDYGMWLGRRGGTPEFDRKTGDGPTYDPSIDDPLLIPSVAVPHPGWSVERMIEAAEKARDGKIAVFQFHGVPEGEHPLTSVEPELFLSFLDYLHAQDYRVIALRDVEAYIDRARLSEDPFLDLARRLGRPEEDAR